MFGLGLLFVFPSVADAQRRCNSKAKPIYAETVAPLKITRGVHGSSRLVIRASGAWRSTGTGKAQSGCLSRAQLASFRRKLASASFARPRQPHSMCDALTTHRHEYHDMIRNRRTVATVPCGLMVSGSVSAMSRWLRSRLKPQVRGATCSKRAGGSVLYMEYHRPMARLRRPLRRPMRSLLVYSNRTWEHRDRRGAMHRGCISRGQLKALRGLISRAKSGRTRARVATCGAINTSVIDIRVSTGARYSWPQPCGVPGRASLMKVYGFVHKVTGVR